MKRIISIICAIFMVLTSVVVLTGCGDNTGLTKEELEFYEEYIQVGKRIEGDEIDALKAKMIEYFKEEYDIDVSEKVSAVKTNLFIPSYNETGNGKHWLGMGEIFISEHRYENEHDLFAGTWIHETVHFIGIDPVWTDYNELYETFTEILALDITEWMGEQDSLTVVYIPAARMCAPMVEANPELVTKTITEKWSYIIESINEVLADTTFTSFEVTEEWTVADQLDAYVESIFQSEKLFEDHDPAVVAGIEEIVNAYCAKFN